MQHVIKPPSNSSPEEIQAWNGMIETLDTFIKASTHLINTLTEKVRGSAMPNFGKQIGAIVDLKEACEPECEPCQPIRSCGVCDEEGKREGSSLEPGKMPSGEKHIPSSESGASDGDALKTQTEQEHDADNKLMPREDLADKGAQELEGDEVIEKLPEVYEESEEMPEPIKADDIEKGADFIQEVEEEKEESGGGGGQIASDSDGGATTVTEEVKMPEKLGGDGGTAIGEGGEVESTDNKKKEGLTDKVRSCKKCICAAKRAEREKLKAHKKGCVCDSKHVEGPKIEPPKLLCACGPSQANREAIVQEMMQKLIKAQNEIIQIQEDLGRFQRSDPFKKTGPHATPNPAKLYQEIMKDTQSYPSTPHLSQRPPGLNQCATDCRGRGLQQSIARFPCTGMPQSILKFPGAGIQQGAIGFPSVGMQQGAVRFPGAGTQQSSKGYPYPLPGGFQSLAGTTTFSPETLGAGIQQGGAGIQQTPKGCPCPSSGGFHSLAGNTTFSPDTTESPLNICYRSD